MNSNLIGLAPFVGGMFLLLALLSGCSTTPDTQVIKTQLNIPEQMFQCEEAGVRPSGEVIMESEVARYISTLEWSQKDCKTRLKEVAIIVKCFNDTDCNVDKLAEYMGLVRETKQR
jgi:hypothetical protein